MPMFHMPIFHIRMYGFFLKVSCHIFTHSIRQTT